MQYSFCRDAIFCVFVQKKTMITALTNLRLISDGVITTGKAVLIENEKIIAVIVDNDIPTDATRIDLKNNFLAPGLIDLQVYGSGGKLIPAKNIWQTLWNKWRTTSLNRAL